MTDIETESDKAPKTQDGNLFFHFDVPAHRIPLNQFIDTARSTNEILETFNSEFFDSKLKYQLYVGTPREGGLIEILALVVTSGMASIWGFLGTEIGKAFIKGLTKEEPKYWALKLGEKIRERLFEKEDSSTLTEEEKSTYTIDDKEIAAQVIVEIILAFIIIEPNQLAAIGLSKQKFRLAYSAKNKIYQGCLDNPEVQALGFDESHSFPIKRNEFPRHIVEIPPEEEPESDNLRWIVDTPDLTVNSPNWERDGRKWQAKTAKFKDIAFSIEDEMFWHHVKIKDIQPDINDNMKVQWAYPGNVARPTNVRVLRVLNYNGKKISDPLGPDQLESMLSNFSTQEKDHPDLFD